MNVESLSILDSHGDVIDFNVKRTGRSLVVKITYSDTSDSLYVDIYKNDVIRILDFMNRILED